MSEPSYKEILAVHQSIMEAETPIEDRVMYFYQISWWRHPIKRWRQKRFYRHILQTTEEAIKAPKKENK